MRREGSRNPGADFDLLIIGGGVNGAGIARDATGRGFSVCLCEANDFASGTSSASTKLLHGGLRYLEYFELRLVREALIERENLLVAMPHISWPMRFVLPYRSDARFENDTPASRLLSRLIPWMQGRRPAWLIRLGLFLYDHLGGRKILPGTRTLDLRHNEVGKPLKPAFTKAFEFSDCWVDDSRLVILNLRDAAQKGADVNPRTRLVKARYANGRWEATLVGRDGSKRNVTASMIVNAAGPWVDQVLKTVFGRNDTGNVRLVRGSHIVIPKKYPNDHCYFFQNVDGRVMFAIPYEEDYTLIGTTDVDHDNVEEPPKITKGEIDYLCEMASEYFAEPVRADEIVWTFSGIRPLFDDGTVSAEAATRDYVIRRDPGEGALINIFGGKITTFRQLSESVLSEIEDCLGTRGNAWTRRAPLPGGDIEIGAMEAFSQSARVRYPFLEPATLHRLVRTYGTEIDAVLDHAATKPELGQDFGHGLYETELRWLIREEWAQDAEDVLFRRSRLGLRMNTAEIRAVDDWMERQVPAPQS